MKLPGAERVRVDETRVVDYLLSARHPDGRSKAAFFASFGFRVARWDVLAGALREHGARGEVTGVAASAHGTRYSVDGVIESPDQRNPRVRTVWIVADEGSEPRLVTAHPLRRQDARRT